MKGLRAFVLAVLLVFVAYSVGLAKVKVYFWHAMGGPHKAAIKALEEKFEALHPDIDIVPIYKGRYGQLSQAILAAVAAKKPPTIAQVYENWTTKLIVADALIPLEKFIYDPDVGFTPEEWEDIFKVFRDDNTYDHIVYTLPFNKSNFVLYWNKKYFKEAGLDPDRPPRTWEELREYARKLTIDRNGDGKPEVYGFGIRPTLDIFEVFLYQAGGRFFDEEGNPAFNGKEGIEALRFIKSFLDEGIAWLQGGYLSTPFGQGKVAMYIGSSAGYPYVKKAVAGKFDWGVGPLPKGKVAAAPFMGTNIALFKGATQQQQLAAWEFIKFLLRPENTAFWSVKTGYLPLRKTALEEPILIEFLKKEPRFEGVLKQFDVGYFEPRHPAWYTARWTIAKYVEKALRGKMTVEEALNKAAAEVKAIFEKENERLRKIRKEGLTKEVGR